MTRTWVAAIALAGLMSSTAAAQDAKTVISTASKAMGVDNLSSIDMFNLPTAAAPVPNPPVVGAMLFIDNIDRLKLDPEKILSVHTLNPDRLATRADILASLGRK